MKYWLMKTEPSEFSLDDLRNSPGGTAPWDGVRNYQARNYLRDEARVGDRVLFYHSGGKAPAVAGLARVARAAYPDDTAWNPASPYHDPRSTPEAPLWYRVDLRFERAFAEPLTLARLREVPELAGMALLRKGMRLSVQPVTPHEFKTILALAGSGPTRRLAASRPRG